MQTFIIVQRYIEQFFYERSDHPVSFWIVVVINIGLIPLIALNKINELQMTWKLLSRIERVFSILSVIISVTLLPLVSITITCTGDVVEATDLFNNQFFAEIIIISFGVLLLKTIKLIYDYKYLKTDEDTENDDGDSDESIALKSITLIIISILFLLTDLEDSLINWGFSIFNHNLGVWIFGLYAAWSCAAVVRFIEATIAFINFYPTYAAVNAYKSRQDQKAAINKEALKRFLYGSLFCFLFIIIALAGVCYLNDVSGETDSWGPQNRATYTMESPASEPTFNSIIDNPTVGDERDFVRIGEINNDITGFSRHIEECMGFALQRVQLIK